MESDPLPWFIFGIALAFLILINVLEIAYAFTNRSDIRRASEEGSERALLLDELYSQTPHLYLALSILKYTSLLAMGAASSLFIVAANAPVLTGVYVLMSWLLLALLQPVWRVWALQRSTTIALASAPLLQFLLIVLRPLIGIIYQINEWVGNSPTSKDDQVTFSDETLRLFIQHNENREEIEENEREMITNILEMNETSTHELMVPRIDMVTMNVDTPLRDALDVIINAGHSRDPVYEDNIDSVIGILYAKDLLQCFRDNQTDKPIAELLRPASFAPASKKIDVLLQEMQKQRVHIVLVVDEYGGTAGLVTIEDILEEIVGDIQDEYDLEEETYVEAIGLNTYLLNSRLDVYSLTKLLNIELETDNADTLGGLLYTLMEHVPKQGESIECEGWRFTVLSLDGRRIEQVRAELVPLSGETETAQEREHLPGADRASSRDTLVNVQVMDP